MVSMNEFHHAFISARFFVHLKESKRANYEDIFLFALNFYGSQRGRRMAQRALRDGRPLDFASYRHYSEWSFTPDFLSSAGDFFKETDRSEDYSYEVYDCPWNRVYQSLGLPDGAMLYCRDLDKSIARGFNPALVYEVTRFENAKTLCIQTQKNAGLEKDSAYPAPSPEDKRDFLYHCGHIYDAFRRVLGCVLGPEGDRISGAVLTDFAEKYGEEQAEALLSAASADFDLI